MNALPTLADRFRDHACRMQPGLYRSLLYEMADDWQAGGVVATICRGRENSPASDVIQLRLLAGVARLVLSRQAPELAMYYPNLGGEADPAGAWPQFRQVLAEHVEQLQEALLVAPQTNEPGRSASLLVGIFDAVRRTGYSRIRLLEPGASAGLNLLVDRFRIGGVDPESWTSGPPSSPLRLDEAVIGPVRPVDYSIVERRGCDLSPVDPRSQDGRLRLTSFVWPHHLDRHARLKAALDIARDVTAPVDASAAAPWVARQLSEPVADGVLTVLWHSISHQYWPDEEIAEVAAQVDQAARRMPIAHITMESPQSDRFAPVELVVDLRVPGQPAEGGRRLALVADHGVPVTMLSG